VQRDVFAAALELSVAKRFAEERTRSTHEYLFALHLRTSRSPALVPKVTPPPGIFRLIPRLSALRGCRDSPLPAGSPAARELADSLSPIYG